MTIAQQQQPEAIPLPDDLTAIFPFSAFLHGTLITYNVVHQVYSGQRALFLPGSVSILPGVPVVVDHLAFAPAGVVTHARDTGTGIDVVICLDLYRCYPLWASLRYGDPWALCAGHGQPMQSYQDLTDRYKPYDPDAPAVPVPLDQMPLAKRMQAPFPVGAINEDGVFLIDRYEAGHVDIARGADSVSFGAANVVRIIEMGGK